MTFPIKLISLLVMTGATVFAQVYAPPVGQPGSTALHKDSSAFVAWATSCESLRGPQNIVQPGGPFASVGDNSMVLGKALSNGVLSLGDGGSATCTFASPIVNGPGPDFAVFENGFDDLFLELAFVEVSSDGINFIRFRCHSLTDTLTQTDSFGPTDATRVNNFAGKYRGGYGTPFDLAELAGAQNLNVNAVTHVRVIDVIGNISLPYATRDSYGRKINDPWPTDFPSGGFDLDAIGVIHQAPTSLHPLHQDAFAPQVFPNPATPGTNIHLTGNVTDVELTDLSGRCLVRGDQPIVALPDVPAGVYLLRVNTPDGFHILKLVVQ